MRPQILPVQRLPAWAKATLSDPAPPRCKRFIRTLAIGKSSCQMALLPLESCPEDA